MKNSLILGVVFFTLGFSNTNGQRRFDYNWLAGYNSTVPNLNWGGAGINFNVTPPLIFAENRDMNLFETNFTMSDSLGNLLFYTNGCDIADRNHQIMYNGENINPGPVHTIQCSQQQGLGAYTSGVQSMIALPQPDSSNIYYLFHKRIVYATNDVFTNTLFYSVINAKGNNGSGIVENKNYPIIQDTLEFGAMSAVRHANGKDWWIVTPRRNSNQFYIILFNSSGIGQILSQTIGNPTVASGEGGGQVVFSPDGSKYIRYNPASPLQIYSFDRSNGHFTGYEEIEVNYSGDSHQYGGVAVSPNNQYLYLSAELNIFQFDLNSDDIGLTQTLIAHYDGFADPLPSTFAMCQLGPNCKIYVLTGQITKYYHIIHNPNEAGQACNFEFRGVEFPTFHGGAILLSPNYRLGSINDPGVPCSTVAPSNLWTHQEVPPISVFPNPASSFCRIIFNYTIEPSTQISIMNVFGQRVQLIDINENPDSLTLSLNELSNGVYWIVLSNPARIIYKKSIVILN